MGIGMLLEKLKTALQEPGCAYCGKPPRDERLLCPVCVSRLGLRENYPLWHTESIRLYAATLFNASIKKVIYGHKFYRQSRAGLMASLLIQYWRQVPVPCCRPEEVLVVSIPPHEDKQDHLQGLVRQFANRQGYRYASGILSWQRSVEPQHHLAGKRRRFENVKNGLQAELSANPEQWPKLIVVVDDITTTGATMMEAARALRQETAGTVPVIGLAVCSVSLALQKHLL